MNNSFYGNHYAWQQRVQKEVRASEKNFDRVLQGQTKNQTEDTLFGMYTHLFSNQLQKE